MEAELEDQGVDGGDLLLDLDDAEEEQVHPALMTDVVLSTIFDMLERRDLENCRLVCKSWCRVSAVSFLKTSKVCLFSSIAGDARNDSEDDNEDELTLGLRGQKCQSLLSFLEFLKRRNLDMSLSFDNFDLCLQEHGNAVKLLALPDIKSRITCLNVSVMGPCMLWLKPILPQLEMLKFLELHGGMENELLRKEYKGSLETGPSGQPGPALGTCKVETLKIQSFARGIAPECMRWILPMSTRLKAIELDEVHYDECKCLEILHSGYAGPGLEVLKMGGTMETSGTEEVAVQQGEKLCCVLNSCVNGNLKELSLEYWARLPSYTWRTILTPKLVLSLEILRFSSVIQAKAQESTPGSMELKLLSLDFATDPRDFLCSFPRCTSWMSPKLKTLKMNVYYRILDSIVEEIINPAVQVETWRTFPNLEKLELFVEGVDLRKRRVLVSPIHSLVQAFPRVRQVSLSGIFVQEINSIFLRLPSTVESLSLGSDLGSFMHTYDVKDEDFLQNDALLSLQNLRKLKLHRGLRCNTVGDAVVLEGFLKLPHLEILSLYGHTVLQTTAGTFSQDAVSALQRKLLSVELRVSFGGLF